MRWAELGIAVPTTIVAVFALLIVSTLITILLHKSATRTQLAKTHATHPHVVDLWRPLFSLAMVVDAPRRSSSSPSPASWRLKFLSSDTYAASPIDACSSWAYLAIPLQYYWVYTEWYGMFIVFIPVYMFLLLPVRMISIGQTEGFLRAAGMLHWSLMTMVFSLSHAAFLLILRLTERPHGTARVRPGALPGGVDTVERHGAIPVGRPVPSTTRSAVGQSAQDVVRLPRRCRHDAGIGAWWRVPI